MSRIAKNPVPIPSGVEINISEKIVSVSGSKGKSEFTLPESVSAIHADDVVTFHTMNLPLNQLHLQELLDL